MINQRFPRLQKNSAWNEKSNFVRLTPVLKGAEANLQGYAVLFCFRAPLLANLLESCRYIAS